MGDIAKENVNLAMDFLLDDSVDQNELFANNEQSLNFLNKNVTAYLTKLMGKELSVIDDKKVGSYYHVVSDLERVGDYAENIVEYALKLRKAKLSFSDEAKEELTKLTSKINELYEIAIKAFNDKDESMLASVEEIEESIDEASAKLEDFHIERVKKGLCTAEVGSVYLQTVSHLERIGDHITNVAKSIRKYRD